MTPQNKKEKNKEINYFFVQTNVKKIKLSSEVFLAIGLKAKTLSPIFNNNKARFILDYYIMKYKFFSFFI